MSQHYVEYLFCTVGEIIQHIYIISVENIQLIMDIYDYVYLGGWRDKNNPLHMSTPQQGMATHLLNQ